MNIMLSFQQVTWRDVMWYDMTCMKTTTRKDRPEWTILDAMGQKNNNHPQEWEDNIVIEK